MADWFVAQPHNTITGDGTLNNPWRGFQRINWSVINQGDTLWILGSWIADDSYSHGGYPGKHCAANPLGNDKLWGSFSSSSVNPTDDTINLAAAGLALQVGASLWFRTWSFGSSLPSPLVAHKEYFIHSINGSIVKLTDIPNGDPIDITTTGSGMLAVTTGGNILKSGITIRGDWNPNNIATARWINRVFKTFYNTGVNGVRRMTTNTGYVSNNLQLVVEDVNGTVPDAYDRPVRLEFPSAFVALLNVATDIDTNNDTISATPTPPNHTRIFFRTPSSGTVLPINMSASSTIYYVVDSDPDNNRFKISTSRGGSPVNLIEPSGGKYGIAWCRSCWEEFYPSDVNTTTYEITLDGSYSIDDAVLFETSGTLPSGLLTNTRYYVVSSSGGKIKVSTTKGGSPQVISTQGSGNHLITKEYSDEILNTLQPGQMLNPGVPGHYRYYKPVGNPSIIGEIDPGKLIRLYNVKNVTIKNLNLWGGLDIHWCEDITLENVNIKYAPYAAIVSDCVRPITRNCTARWCNSGFYYFGDFTRDGIIEGCVVEDVGFDLFGAASSDEQAYSIANPLGQNYIRNCVLRRSGNGLVAYLDDDINGNPYEEDQRLDIYNNWIEDQYGSGVHGYARYGTSGNALVCSFPELTGTSGKYIWNMTTGATGTITGLTHTYLLNDTAITSMSGGTRSTWQVGDAFCILGTSLTGIAGAGIDVHGPAPKHPNYIREIRVYNNIVVRAVIGGCAPVVKQDYANTSAVKYYNNIFYGVMAGIRIFGDGAGYNAGDFHSQNNIFYLVPTKFNVYGLNSFYIIQATNIHQSASFLINNNCYYHTTLDPEGDLYFITSTVRNRAYYLTWVRQKGQNQESSVVLSDPKVDNQEMKLSTDSPCRRAGVFVIGTSDYFGNPRFNEPGGVCIGAHEKWDNITTNIGS